MIASRTPPVAGKTGRPELLLICGSTLTVIAILCIVTFLLIREHANAQESATRSATTIAQLIDADVLRTVELYDLTLQGLIAAAQDVGIGLPGMIMTSMTGSYLLKFPYSREPELVMDILKYGADVEVLAPESLRTAVSAQINAAAKLYPR